MFAWHSSACPVRFRWVNCIPSWRMLLEGDTVFPDFAVSLHLTRQMPGPLMLFVSQVCILHSQIQCGYRLQKLVDCHLWGSCLLGCVHVSESAVVWATAATVLLNDGSSTNRGVLFSAYVVNSVFNSWITGPNLVGLFMSVPYILPTSSTILCPRSASDI